jgi:hypothetical protein
LVAAIFGIAADSGMKTVDRMPDSRAARATPCAWFPADAATTPISFWDPDSRLMALSAPRILNEPVLWRFSALRRTSPPVRREKEVETIVGVSRTTGRMVSLAAWMSESCTGMDGRVGRYHGLPSSNSGVPDGRESSNSAAD